MTSFETIQVKALVKPQRHRQRGRLKQLFLKSRVSGSRECRMDHRAARFFIFLSQFWLGCCGCCGVVVVLLLLSCCKEWSDGDSVGRKNQSALICRLSQWWDYYPHLWDGRKRKMTKSYTSLPLQIACSSPSILSSWRWPFPGPLLVTIRGSTRFSITQYR